MVVLNLITYLYPNYDRAYQKGKLSLTYQYKLILTEFSEAFDIFKAKNFGQVLHEMLPSSIKGTVIEILVGVMASHVIICFLLALFYILLSKSQKEAQLELYAIGNP